MSFVFAPGGSETATTTTVSESGFNTNEVLTFVIPGSTGGGTDLTIRTMGEGLQRLFGLKINYQQMTNTIGHKTVKSASLDGNTIMLATIALLTQYVSGNSEVNPLEDLTLVACLDDNGYSVLACPVNAPFNTFEEFVAYAKATPRKINAGMPAAVSNTFLFGKLESVLGIELNHVECAWLWNDRWHPGVEPYGFIFLFYKQSGELRVGRRCIQATGDIIAHHN